MSKVSFTDTSREVDFTARFCLRVYDHTDFFRIADKSLTLLSLRLVIVSESYPVTRLNSRRNTEQCILPCVVLPCVV